MTRSEADPAGIGPTRRVLLGNGQALETRPVSRADVEALAALYERLSDDDLVRRFSTAERPDRAVLEEMTTVETRGGHRLVAVVRRPGGAGRLVGEAGYELLPNGDGELEMTTVVGFGGWLGRFLLGGLLEAADARGVPNLEADVPFTDTSALALARSVGAVVAVSDDARMVRVLIGTHGELPTWPGRHDRPRVLVESSTGRWRAGRAAAAAGMQVLICSGPQDHHCPAVMGRPCPLAASADAIVVTRPPRDQRWVAVHEAHRPQHPGVPVCVQYRRSRYTDPPGALELPDDTVSVVAAVDRVAREHASAADGWLDRAADR